MIYLFIINRLVFVFTVYIYDNMCILEFCQQFFYFFILLGVIFIKNRFAVIGFPLGHTMSPFIHNHMFGLTGIDATYESVLVSPDELEQKMSLLKTYDGFNVTIPHKQTIIPFLNSLGDSAKLYGAVNTVANKDGFLTGHSTDADGFKSALELEDISLKGDVLICGAGGVSRTIATECILAECNVTLAVREQSLDKAKLLADELTEKLGKKVKFASLTDVSGCFDIAVNGTPVGMYPNTNASVLTDEQLSRVGFVFDSVYNPESTALVTNAKKLGIKAASGMGMLVLQAAKAQEHWYGATFTKNQMKNLIALANDEMRRVFSE